MYGGGVSHWSNLRCFHCSIHLMRNLLLLLLMPALLSCGVRDGQPGRKSEYTLLSEADLACMRFRSKLAGLFSGSHLYSTTQMQGWRVSNGTERVYGHDRVL